MIIARKAQCLPFKALCSYLLLMFAFFMLTSCESEKTIVYGLDQNEANEILVFLSSKGLEAEKVKSLEGGGGGGSKITLWDIAVKSSDANEAMRQLNQQGLPRRRGQNVLGIFSTGGLVTSDLQDKIKYRAALAEQLASTIRKYEGVLDADVQISFPEEDPLNPGKSKGKITASIWVKHSGILNDPNSHLSTQIKRFVASAITGLNYDDITIVGERSRFGDAPVEGSASLRESEKQYVNVWGIVLSKESVSFFRWIFFTFSILLLLLALSLVWFLWKIHPVISKHGGIKSLFSVKPLLSSSPEKKEEEVADTTAKKEEPKKAKPSIEKDIDET
ncbi:MAG: type III secretion inner membrane ring lipoprotein SctJ [Parachlamydiaceae bacterium]|nr:type III secretion inner membrane ring lipoprotein SctJ [Parachlamydiaceae bacterium]